MIPLTVGEIAQEVHGTVHGDPGILVTGEVQTDTRQPLEGGLYVAKPGERADGHDFVPQALEGGAVAAIVERRLDGVGIAQIEVRDAVVALGELARGVLRRLREAGVLERVIGVTGSAGKTTTKHILGHLLSQAGPTVIPVGSFNNEVGAPITVLRATAQTRFLVVEMGASREGEIRDLCRIAPPDIGVVLQVGRAHIGVFGGVEQIQRAKSEMVQALTPEGVAVLNRDDALVAKMADLSPAPVCWFGEHPDSDVRISRVRPEGFRTAFDLTLPGEEPRAVSLRLFGEHNAWNAAAAAAAAWNCGLGADQIAAGLNSLEHGERWRMQIAERGDGVTIVNDAYNASPASVMAGLKALAIAGRSGSRTVAVLGAVSELGEYELEEYHRIGLQAVRLNIDQLVVVGRAARLMFLAASQEGSWGGEARFFDTADDAKIWLDGYLAPGDIVYVKSSNSAGLRFLGDDLAKDLT